MSFNRYIGPYLPVNRSRMPSSITVIALDAGSTRSFFSTMGG